MLINQIITGMFELIDEHGKQHGILEYHVKGGMLHVDNVVNYSWEKYKGVGTALMNSAVNFCLTEKLGISFEVDNNSEAFYKAWFENMFTGKFVKSNAAFNYSYDLLNANYNKQKGKQPHHLIKNNEDISIYNK